MLKVQNYRKILVAGATGNLGRHIIQELSKNNYEVSALVRTPEKASHIQQFVDNYHIAEVTQPETLQGLCADIDVVISTVGITKQKDGVTYEDVDYQGNLNLLNEALKSGVKKFVYVSVLNATSMKELRGVHAKLKFVNALKNANIEHLIVNPNGFFADMKEYHEMARKGTVYLFGDGDKKINPIHEADLADVIVKNMEGNICEFDVGGPEVLTHNQIAEIAFITIHKRKKITHIPMWISNVFLWCMRKLTSVKTYGPIEFFMTVVTRDMIARKFGKRTLKEYFISLN